MAKFSAAGIVESLDFDFTAIKGLEDVQGVIPEPSSKQVRAFNEAAQAEVRLIAAQLAEAGTDLDADMPAGLASVLETMSLRGIALSEDAVARQAKMLSALCSGHPTAAQLQKLPYRVMTAFSAWLAGEVMNPETVTGGGDAQVLNLRSSAAG